jgi:hypothetical protein
VHGDGIWGIFRQPGDAGVLDDKVIKIGNRLMNGLMRAGSPYRYIQIISYNLARQGGGLYRSQH